MTIEEFQKHIEAVYLERDRSRGIGGTFQWFAEEVGELARAIRKGDPGPLAAEFADVFAWLATLASLTGVRLEEVVSKYENGCPRCEGVPCACP